MRHPLQIISFYSVFLIIFSLFCGSTSTTTAGWTNLGLYGGQIYDIEFDPDDATRMFTGTFYGDGLYRSSDGGRSWKAVLTGHEDGTLDGEATFRNTAVWAVDIAPSDNQNPDDNTIWAAHNEWVAKSTQGGSDGSWTHISNAAMQDDCTNCPDDGTPTKPGSDQMRFCKSLVIAPSAPQTVYVGTGGPNGSEKRGAVYKTTDGGLTWTKLGMTITGYNPAPDNHPIEYEDRDLDREFYSEVVALAVHPTDSNIVWAVDFNSAGNKFLCQLYLSTDGGQTWSRDIGLESHLGESALAVKPDEPNVVYVGTFSTLARLEYPKDNQGVVQWDLAPQRTYPLAWGTSWNVRALAFDPRDAKILYVAMGLEGHFELLKSLDGGKTFSHRYGHDQQFIHLAPHPTDSRVIFGGDRLKGVFRGDLASGDITWRKQSQGIQSIKISDVAIDPNDSSHYLAATMAGLYELRVGDNAWTRRSRFNYTEAFSVAFDTTDATGNTYYSGAESYLYKTVDGGVNWSQSNSLGYPHFVNDIAIDPANADDLFITTRQPGSVYKSTNGGRTLTMVLDGKGRYDFGAVAIDPSASDHVYAGGGNYFQFDVPGNLFESTAGGESGSWIPILPAVTVNALLIDPDAPNRVYAGCGFSDGTAVPIYRSTDGGDTWQASYAGIPGQPTRYGIWGSSPNDLFVLKHTGSVVKSGHHDRAILHFDGRKWHDIDLGVSSPLFGLWGNKGSDVFAVGTAGTILHYDGSTWSSKDSGVRTDLLGVAGSSSNQVVAVGKSGTILGNTGGGWSTLASGTYKDLQAVWSAGDGSHLFAVGDHGTILHSTDQATWTRQASGTTQALQGVWGTTATDVFTVGNGGTILRYVDGKWSAMSSGTTRNLNAVWGTKDAAHVYAVGEGGIILHYSAGRWSAMSSGTDATIYSVWGTAADRVYAAGQYGTLLLYDGSLWTDVTVGFNEAAIWNDVTDLQFKVEDGNRIIYASTSRQGVYASADGGSTWTHMTTPPYVAYALATGSVIVGTQGGVLSMSGYGLLYGRVTDNLGIAIPDAQVKTDLGKSTKSAVDGRWSMGLKAGTYHVSASIPGYGRVTEANVPIYDATGTFVGLQCNDRSIYVNIGNREVLGTGGVFNGTGGRVTPTTGVFTWSEGNGSGELMARYGKDATLTVQPNAGMHAQVTVDGQPHGTGPIQFLASTASHTINVLFKTGTPPVIHGTIPPQSKNEDANPWTLDLTAYETDTEDSGATLNWSISGADTSLFSAVVTDSANDILTFAPVADAHGVDDILLTLTDSHGLTDTQTIRVTLRSQNDAPLVGDIPDQTITKNENFVQISLDKYVSDEDNPDREITWTTDGGTALTIAIADRIATVTMPHADWSGSETITFTATDAGPLADSDTAIFTRSANNPLPSPEAGSNVSAAAGGGGGGGCFVVTLAGG